MRAQPKQGDHYPQTDEVKFCLAWQIVHKQYAEFVFLFPRTATLHSSQTPGVAVGDGEDLRVARSETG